MKIQPEPIVQMHFDFKDWKECFTTWKENLPIYGDNMQMVISTHWASAGYWIEHLGKELTHGDTVYVGKEVMELEMRVKRGIKQAEESHTAPCLIL
jgi:hypothetical protein